MKIRIRRQPGSGGPPETLADLEWPSDGEPPAAPAGAQALENDRIDVRVVVPRGGPPPCLRVFAGSVLVASSLYADKVAFIDHDDYGDADGAAYYCRGPFLADWVGLTELVVRLDAADGEAKVLVSLPLAVSGTKMSAEQFDMLFRELERESMAALMDVHGKTSLGLRVTEQVTSTGPMETLTRLRETITELNALLGRVSRQPAGRLRLTRSREPALPGQAVSEATLVEAAGDPGMLTRAGRRLVFREQVREYSQPDFRIPEHDVVADFKEYLKGQLGDLRARIDEDIEERLSRKSWRSNTREDNKQTWWQTEDAPRVEELTRCREEVIRLRGVVARWDAYPFLPPGRPLRRKPESTPLFQNHPVYRRVFRVLVSHFLRYRTTLDNQPVLIRARSLPMLYEWWCSLRVIRILSALLLPVSAETGARTPMTGRLAQEGRRFTLEFAPDQVMAFTDGKGARVRFRYQPVYRSNVLPGLRGVSVLTTGTLRTPDMAVEIYPAGDPHAATPELIIVFDAKYSSLPQTEKMHEVTTKYARIGDARTGRVLSRQVWALTPAGGEGFLVPGDLRGYCTVDNRGFWSSEFDAAYPVNGAIQTRPVRPGAFDPLRELIVRLLRAGGVGVEE